MTSLVWSSFVIPMNIDYARPGREKHARLEHLTVPKQTGETWERPGTMQPVVVQPVAQQFVPLAVRHRKTVKRGQQARVPDAALQHEGRGYDSAEEFERPVSPGGGYESDDGNFGGADIYDDHVPVPAPQGGGSGVKVKKRANKPSCKFLRPTK